MTDTKIDELKETFDGLEPANPAERPGKPAMLSHVAYMTRDTEATADFFTRILGMELVNAVLDDSVPSTGEPIPYFHSFFKMSDGSTVAFFEAPELPPLEDPPHAAYNTFQHLALQVDTPETVDRWHDWLEACGVEVLGPVDHKIIYSVYFHDPSGLRLEITAPTSPLWNDNAEHAAVQLADWTKLKENARASGADLVSELNRFAAERSHRKA
jgi:catechol 2,3-dioxygenase-like lactoylglutathione lyase family enzyme